MSAQATDNRTEWNEKGEKGEEEKEGEEEENNPVKSPFSCYSPVNKKKGKSLKRYVRNFGSAKGNSVASKTQ